MQEVNGAQSVGTADVKRKQCLDTRCIKEAVVELMNEPTRPFVVFVHDGDSLVFLNLERVTNAVIKKDECTLFFSETHTITISGEGGRLIMKLLAERAVLLDGTPLTSKDDFASLRRSVKDGPPN